MTEEHRIRFPTFKEHVKNRSMWKGSNVITEQQYWMFNEKRGQFEMRPGHISEALLKCFDEIIVNALDQYVRSVGTPVSKGGPVSIIEVRFNRENGEITVYNNGQGFEIYNNHPDLPPDMYTVEGVITRERSGTNFGDIYGSNDDADRVTGGINGLGMKLIILDSDLFTIETVDKIRNVYYKQSVLDSMSTVDPPIVLDLGDTKSAEVRALSLNQKKPHTTISFIPDYANLCRSNKSRRNPKWVQNAQYLEEFEKIIQFRVYQAAAFIGSISYRYEGSNRIEYKNPGKVYFNGNPVPVRSTEDLAKLMPADKVQSCVIRSANDDVRFPWSIAIGDATSGEPGTVSLVNGVHLIEGGSHINWLFKQITEHVNKKAKAAFKKKEDSPDMLTDTRLRSMFFLVDSLQIPLPQFTSQSKVSIKLSTKDLNKMKRTYVLPTAFLDKVWNMIKDEVQFIVMEKENAASKTTKTRKVKIRKYEPARWAGKTQHLKDLMLFIPEGDSACKPIRDIIAHKETPLSSKTCGTYNIQGVPPNALKNIKEQVSRSGKKIKTMTKMLRENIALQGLAAAAGLDYTKTYFYGDPNKPPTPEIRAKRKIGDAEFATLNYGVLPIFTDQDKDGIGQICSLIMVYIYCFWPELYNRGFLARVDTPIIRVYTNNKAGDVINFSSEPDYDRWIKENYGSELGLPAAYKVKYYKGIAGHTEEEIIYDIGMNIMSNIYRFTLDDAAEETIKIAYGTDVGPRKEFLHTPVSDSYDPADMEQQRIPISKHILIEAKAYQLDFASRKLKNAVDGFIPSQRKAFAGGRKMARTKGEAKVYQVTGKVTTDFHYQHGDASMNDTIIKMAQNFTGACNLPLFTPISNGFGDRRNGRDETGSPRYINTRLNTRLADAMFPPEDDWLLDYVFEDGEQAEPQFYVPVAPISIMETSTTVAVGWNIECWGRDPYEVLDSIERLIDFDYPDGDTPVRPRSLVGKVWIPEGMSIDVCKYSASVSKATEVCFGSYSYDEKKNEVHITQLPLKIWSYNYKCMLEGIKPDSKGEPTQNGPKEYVKAVYDETGNDQTDIIVKLHPGAYEKICEQYGTDDVDPLEEYLDIRKQMHCRLNMITHDGSIKEFETYESVIEYWFPIRRKLYEERINRRTLLLQYEIEYWENVLRFIIEDATGVINIDKEFTAEQRAEILSSAKYVRFNKTLLFNPRYTKVENLHDAIFKTGASYAYIDAITKGEQSQAGIKKLQDKLDDLRAQLEELRETTWKKMWLHELSQLRRVIEEGIKSKWLFGTKQHVFKKAEPKKKPTAKK